MVCGKPFETKATEVDNLFLAQTYSLLQDLGSAPVGLGVVNEHQITDKMRQVRILDLAERRQVYLEGRIHDQQRWYAEKASGTTVAPADWCW
jgi:SMODS and SLOG-associating 2TM effector domain 3